MSSAEIDDYLAGLEEPKRSTLAQLRRAILELLPSAEEGISYRLPAFRLEGVVVAGFGAFREHLSYFPHSGSVLEVLRDELAGYRCTRRGAPVPRGRGAAEQARRSAPRAPDRPGLPGLIGPTASASPCRDAGQAQVRSRQRSFVVRRRSGRRRWLLDGLLTT